MTGKSQNLAVHHLSDFRAHIDARFDKLATAHANLTAEVRLSNAHVAALVQGEVHVLGRFSEVEARLDRIERRLKSETRPRPRASSGTAGKAGSPAQLGKERGHVRGSINVEGCDCERWLQRIIRLLHVSGSEVEAGKIKYRSWMRPGTRRPRSISSGV